MIPGSNLLNMAAQVITLQSVDYYRFYGNTTTDEGLKITSYNPKQIIKASVQAVPRNRYEAYGLDLQKNYITLFSSNNMIDIARDFSGDQVWWNNRTYQLVSETPWFAMDGWNSVMAVEIELGPYTGTIHEEEP